MAFTFDIDVASIIAERRAQFAGAGVPEAVISEVAARTHEFWEDRPGSWPFEWSAVAERELQSGNSLLASSLYGIAKFPCLGNAAHVHAYQNQLRVYKQLARSIPQKFKRQLLPIVYRGVMTPVVVHLLSEDGLAPDAPVILMAGGVDTWKMDIHSTAIALGQQLRVHTALVDIPGVGESVVPSAPDGDAILGGVTKWLGQEGRRRVGVFGFSFGGYWALKLALTGQVDTAVAVGGCASVFFEKESLSIIPNGMPGILGNSLFRSAPFQSIDELYEAMHPFSLRDQGLYEWPRLPVPLLVVNGAADPYVPNADVTDFAKRANTATRLVPGATHCAAKSMRELMPWIVEWLRSQLVGP